MNTSHGEDQDSTWNCPISKTEEIISPETGNHPIVSSESSATSYDDNQDIIEFGPIKVKPRKKPAPTLATGRRSKYEPLSPEEEQKREVRRARNRAAAERVRINRLNVEQELQGQIDTLEQQEKILLNNLQILEYQKLNLETRLSTHRNICPTMNGTHPQSSHLMSAFNNPNPPVFQQVEQISDINLEELFLDSPDRLENNYSNSLTTMIPDDIDDFFMNP
jgi:hypothetical protein